MIAQTILLIHGAWHGAWAWEAVADLLRSTGHTVLVPTLAGSGERSDEIAESVSLESQVAELAEMIENQREPVVIVAHSLGGVHATLLADRLAPRIARLVLIDAEVPEDGECALGPLPIASAYQELIEAFRIGPNRLAPLPIEFFGLPEGTLRDAQAAQLRPHPERAFTDPVCLSNRPLNGLPCIYLLATDPPSEDGKLYAVAKRLAKESGVRTIEVPASHMMLLSHPERIVELILNGKQG